MSTQVMVICAPPDEAMCDELVTHLGVFQDAGSLRIWRLHDIAPGEDRRSAVRKHLDNADVLVVLVSAALMHWAEKQPIIERALARSREGHLRLIPVLLRPCVWGDSSVAHLQVLPRDGRPVTSWENRDEAWVQIAEALRTMPGPQTVTFEPRPSARAYRAAQLESPVLELETQFVRRRALLESGDDPQALDDRIRDLKRTLREGGQLQSGDSLDIDRYFLLRQLGYGGFATVWEADDRQRRTRVAVKVLHPQLSGKAEFRRRFFRGARIMSQIDHPAVVKILQPPQEEVGFHYFIMELLEGGDLHRAVLQGRVSRDEVARLVLRIGEALAIGHDQKFIHRDISPHNILLDSRGQAKLTDFDLVTAPETLGDTHAGVVLGKVFYAAPEVLENPHDVDGRADVYGLGMTAVFCLYGAELPRTILVDRAKVFNRIQLPAVAEVLQIAIDPNRERRFTTMRAFCDAFRAAWADGRSPSLRAPERRLESSPPAVFRTAEDGKEAEESRAAASGGAPARSTSARGDPSGGGTVEVSVRAPHVVLIEAVPTPSAYAQPDEPQLPERVESRAAWELRAYIRVAGPSVLLIGMIGMTAGIMPATGKALERASQSSVVAGVLAISTGTLFAARFLRRLQAAEAGLMSLLAGLALFTGIALALLFVEARAYVQTLLAGDLWRLALARREAYRAVLETGLCWPLGLLLGYAVFWVARRLAEPLAA